VHHALKSACPFLRATQTTNLALLVSALLAKRTLCLSGLARAYPTPAVRRVARPKHDLLHRLKRLWRFLDNPRVDAQAVQLALIPHTVAKLGTPRWLGLAVDWTFFDSVLPSGERVRYQVLRVAVPRRGRAVPLLQVAYVRARWPRGMSQNRAEEAAIRAVVGALPHGVRPLVLADRGFARASFLQFLQTAGLDYVVRLDRGTCLTEDDGRRWKLGDADPAPGQLRFAAHVRYGLFHDRPRALWINVASYWSVPPSRRADPRRVAPAAPWYLATSLASGWQAGAWYWQRGWEEQSFKDSKSRCFGLDDVQSGCKARLTRLLAALTCALAGLAGLGLPGRGLQPAGWHAAVAQWGRVSFLTLALELLDTLRDLPASCLPGGT
jgi:hypothetical protein